MNIYLRKAFTEDIKKICIKKMEINAKTNGTSLEETLACKLIPLEKNPGLKPRGIEEVLRRTAEKFEMQIVKKVVIKDVGRLKLCTGQEARSEAAIHGMHKIVDDSKTEAILLVNTENAFNTINTKSDTSQY